MIWQSCYEARAQDRARGIKPCTEKQVSDVPCLCDSSACLGVLSELDSGIVVHFVHCVWPFVLGLPVFAVGVLFDHDAVSDCVFMLQAVLVFTLDCLDDVCLLARFDQLPVGFEPDIEVGVASKHELCRSGPECGVNR